VTIVLDTNVLVAALVANGLCRELVHRTIRLRILATSEALLQELETTVRDKFDLTPPVAAFLDLFRASTEVVDPKPLPAPICRDETDDVVLATAVAAEADVIVTGDQDLLVLGSYQDISIVSPRSFLERLDSGGRPRRTTRTQP
jgi:putative PIN family toxin of toxin-antitoxin system